MQTGKIKLGLSPTMTASELRQYFRNRLPADLSPETFDRGLSCLGDARLILGELGGVEKSRIIWLKEPEGELIPRIAHAFIVPLDATGEDLAYGNEDGDNIAVGYLRLNGKDITDEVLSSPWESL